MLNVLEDTAYLSGPQKKKRIDNLTRRKLFILISCKKNFELEPRT
jgi:hypothetical protein